MTRFPLGRLVPHAAALMPMLAALAVAGGLSLVLAVLVLPESPATTPRDPDPPTALAAPSAAAFVPTATTTMAPLTTSTHGMRITILPTWTPPAGIESAGHGAPLAGIDRVATTPPSPPTLVPTATATVARAAVGATETPAPPSHRGVRSRATGTRTPTAGGAAITPAASASDLEESERRSRAL